MKEVEEVVCTWETADNGAGPLWCYGAPLLVRDGEDVYVSVLETDTGSQPLCNTRWRVLKRAAGGEWRAVLEGDRFDEREPCPLLRVAPGGALMLSVNPLISVDPARSRDGQRKGPSLPHVLGFGGEGGTADQHTPIWSSDVPPTFTEHSYRGAACDVAGGEVLLLNIDSSTGDQYWSLRAASGEWTANGRIAFPIRSCYPQVALAGGAGHVLAIGDIVEPVEEYRAYKREHTGRAWDYVFQRLFYTYSPRLVDQPFGSPVEVANVEATGGHIQNLDLWIDDDGVAHLLYGQRNIASELMRDRFFPGQALVASLEYCRIAAGAIEDRRTLLSSAEGKGGGGHLKPSYGRFHADESGALFVIAGAKSAGRYNNYVLQVSGDGEPEPLGLDDPFTTYFTATPRGGSARSSRLDLFGTGSEPNTLRYARISL